LAFRSFGQSTNFLNKNEGLKKDGFHQIPKEAGKPIQTSTDSLRRAKFLNVRANQKSKNARKIRKKHRSVGKKHYSIVQKTRSIGNIFYSIGKIFYSIDIIIRSIGKTAYFDQITFAATLHFSAFSIAKY